MKELNNKFVVVKEVYGKGENKIVKVADNIEEATTFFESIVSQFDKNSTDKRGKGCLILHHFQDVTIVSPDDYQKMEQSERYNLQCNSYEYVDTDNNKVFVPIADGTILKMERMNKNDMNKI